MALSDMIAIMERHKWCSGSIVDALYMTGDLKEFVGHLHDMDTSPELTGLLVAEWILTFKPQTTPAPKRPYVDRRTAQGPRERWGYDGPVTRMLPEKEWLPLRYRILKRDNWTCKYCSVSGQEAAQWCVDHVHPLSRGGTHDEDNLVACCSPCNSSKADRLLSEWKGRYQ